MSRRFRTLCLVALALWVASAAPARAYHEERERLTRHTAYGLQKGEFLVGLWEAGWAPAEWITLTTVWAPWLVKVANLEAKVPFWERGRWALSATGGFFYLDLSRWTGDENPTRFYVIPVELDTSWRFHEAFTASAGLLYTGMVVEGDYDERDFKGAAGTSNTQLLLALEWRLGRRWALTLRSRHLLGMQLSGKVESTIQPDAWTTLETQASAVSEDILALGFPQTFQVVPGIAYSDRFFNFEAGVGYGNWVIPGINFVLPNYAPIVQLDMYWRF